MNAVRFRQPASVAMALALILGVALQPASGIARRDDVPDNSYTALATSYPAVGLVLLNGGAFGGGVLIAPNYVLTAGHMVYYYNNGVNLGYVLGGSTYQVAWSEENPGFTPAQDATYDIGIIRLSSPVTNVAPAPLYVPVSSSDNELYKQATFVGFGKSGTGSAGENTSDAKGTKRAGTNMIDSFNDPASKRVLKFDFDAPGKPPAILHGYDTAAQLPMESMLTDGDSGGGVFIAGSDGINYLAGIMTSRTNWSPASSYGQVGIATRVSSFATWIDGFLTAGVTWAGTTGFFTDSANWSQTSKGVAYHLVPNAYDNLVFNAAGAHQVNWTSPSPTAATAVAVTAGAVTFDLNSTTFAITPGSGPTVTTTVGGSAAGSSASLTILHGTFQANLLTLGSAATGASGSLILGDGGDLNVHDLSILGAASLFVPVGRTVTIPATGSLTVPAVATFTKSDGGTLIIDGTQTYGAGAIFDVVGGKVILDTDAGAASLATLTLSVTNAEVDFHVDQHLDTLEIGSGGKVAFTGAHMVTVNDLVFDGLTLGAMTLTPEPATLALLGIGLIVFRAGYRRRSRQARTVPHR